MLEQVLFLNTEAGNLGRLLMFPMAMKSSSRKNLEDHEDFHT